LEKLGDFVSVAFTFLFVLIGWIFFSIEEFPNAIAYIKLLFSFNLSIEPILLTYEFKTVMILAFAFSFFGVFNFGKRIQNFFYKEENGLLKTTFNVAISLLLFTVCVSYITASDFNPFIYFRF
jgi:alginate O-acetyltransferase complex protein AlgI